MKKKLLSLALVLAMALTLLPTAVFAADLTLGDVTYEEGTVTVGVSGIADTVTDSNVDSSYSIKYIINDNDTAIAADAFDEADTASTLGLYRDKTALTFQIDALDPGTYYIHVLVNGPESATAVGTSEAVIVPDVIKEVAVALKTANVKAGAAVEFEIDSVQVDGDDDGTKAAAAKAALEIESAVWALAEGTPEPDSDAGKTTAPAAPGTYNVVVTVAVKEANQNYYEAEDQNTFVKTLENITVAAASSGSDEPGDPPAAPTNVTIDISTLEVSWDTDVEDVTGVSIKFFTKNADGEYESASSPAGMTVTDTNTIHAKKVTLTGVTASQLNGLYVGVALTTAAGTGDFAYNEYEIVVGTIVATYELTVTKADYSDNGVDLEWTLKDDDVNDTMTFTYCVHEDLNDDYLIKDTVLVTKHESLTDSGKFTGRADWGEDDALDPGTYEIVIFPDDASVKDGSKNHKQFTVNPSNPNFTYWEYDANAQNAVWMCGGTGTPKFTLTLDGKTFNSSSVKAVPNGNGSTVYTCKIEQTGKEQILVVVCNGDKENAIKITIPAAPAAADVASAINNAVGTVGDATSAEEVKEIIANAINSDEPNTGDPTSAVPAATLTDTGIVKALEKINKARNISFKVTGNQSGSVNDAMKQWIAANADANTEITIEQKTAPKPAASKIPQDYRNKKIATISVEVRFGEEVKTEFGMTFPVVLPIPSGFSDNPANLRVLHYHEDDEQPIVRVPIVDGGSLVLFVKELSDFAIVDLDSSSGGGGSSSGSSVSGSLSGVSKPASKPSTPAAPAAPAAPANIFTDVPAAHTFASQIKWALDNGVMGGYADGSFRPDNNTNRQQLWMVLGRLAGANPADMAAAREWAVGAGISDGSSAEGAMSRQQLVTMLYRFAQSQGKAVTGAADLSAYSDSAAVASYAQEALAWAVGNGIVTGTSDGRLNPEGTASRAHFAAFLYRFSNMG